MHKRLVTLPSWQAAEHRVRPASNLEWALAHRHAFIVGGGNDPTLGLKYVHKRVVPALLNDSSSFLVSIEQGIGMSAVVFSSLRSDGP